MADNRRTPPRGSRPRGRTGPGRVTAGRLSRPTGAADTADGAPGASRARRTPRRPRLTGRAAVLVLVLAVLAISYASSLRAYLQQRAHISDLKSQIAEREVAIDRLESEKRRWNDPAYVEQQARERFGYVMPGEKSYVVLDGDGQPLETEASLSDPDSVAQQPPTPWWADVWSSVELAGHPPKPSAPPATVIDGLAEGPQEE